MSKPVQLYTLTLRRSMPIKKDGVETGVVRDMIEIHKGVTLEQSLDLHRKATGVEDAMREKLRFAVPGKVESSTSIGEVMLGVRTTPKAVLPRPEKLDWSAGAEKRPAKVAPPAPAKKLGGGDLADLVNVMADKESAA